jgi:hypothetical protein
MTKVKSFYIHDCIIGSYGSLHVVTVVVGCSPCIFHIAA